MNRATLARQGLLERWPAGTDPLDAVGRLAGMQAQNPRSPYLALWSRIERFDPGPLSAAVARGDAVRIALMRSTVHLVSRADALAWRPLLQVVIERGTRGAFGREWAKLPDLDAVVAHAKKLLADGPRTPAELGQALHERHPEATPLALSNAARCFLALVQVPPRGEWNRSGAVRLAPLEGAGDSTPEALVLRYLGALGPATVKDAQNWSGLTRLREVVEPMLAREQIVDLGEGYLDLPDAPRPGGATPAPVRLLPDFDNVLLGHADRSRFRADGFDTSVYDPGSNIPFGTVLVDGLVTGSTHQTRAQRTTTLTVRLGRTVSAAQRDEICEEARSLLAFAAPPGDTHEVVIR